MISVSVLAEIEEFNVPYPSYTYDFWEEPVPAPQAYYPSREIRGEDLGVGSFSAPRDLHISNYNQHIYIVDSGNNRIICLDPDWSPYLIIDSFENEGQLDTFANPRGLYTRENGDIYIADRDNARIVILDKEGQLKDIFGAPQTDVDGLIPENFRYRPNKVAVDNFGRTFVIADEVYEGIMEFDIAGNFVGFFGAPEVQVDVFEYLWRFFSPAERRERLALFLPTEYSNIDIDETGFLMTTVSGGDVADHHIVRRLNSQGEDRLRRRGFTPPRGDYGSSLRDAAGEWVIPGSVFVDITARENAIYSTLDQRRGRIFTYDNNGNLLYVFGYDGHLRGGFRNPRAVEARGDQLIVLDSQTNNLTVFEPTEYAKNIHMAINYYENGYYNESVEKWQQILKANANYDLAYTGIGRGMLVQNNYEQAMENFRIGENRNEYSRAFELYRREIMEENLSLVAIYFVALIILLVIVVKFNLIKKSKNIFDKANQQLEKKIVSASLKKEKTTSVNMIYKQIKKVFNGFLYTFHVITHPISGFWDLKHERRGNLAAATLNLMLLIISIVFMRQYTGFIFNTRDLYQLNLLVEISGILIPFLLWCTVNWALTTLMEGKGTFGDIYMTTAYALTPLIFINIPVTVISNYMLQTEIGFYAGMVGFSAIWAALLVFFGTMTIHQYDTGKMILVTIFIIIGIALTMFIGLLFFNLVEQVVGFFTDIYTELVYRI